MPHQCTACGYTFADGSKDMLGGCPDCGGNKFQFYPEGVEVPDEPPGDGSPPSTESGGTASTVGRAATKVRDFVSGDHTGSDTDGSVDPPTPDSSVDTDADTESGPTAADTDRTPSTGSAEDDSTGATDPTSSTSSNSDSGQSTNDTEFDGTVLEDSSDDATKPDPNAPWPDSSDAADPIRKGGFRDERDDSRSGNTDDHHHDGAEDDGIIDADARSATDTVADAEDGAQSEARSDTASTSEVAAAAADNDSATNEEGSSSGERPPDRSSSSGERPPDEGRVVSEPTDDDADIAALREQLNDQFESIKILEPGQYELNLMELYDREEYIIALQENGRYVIQMPEQWMSNRETER